jgi:REP element-mobilizing transposase RayT
MKTYLSDDRHKTCKRIHESGDTHFITFSCYKRRPLLNNNDALSILGASLSDACITTDTALWSYVFMPEHVHLLIHPRSALFTTSHFLSNFKRIASCRLHNTHVMDTTGISTRERSLRKSLPTFTITPYVERCVMNLSPIFGRAPANRV